VALRSGLAAALVAFTAAPAVPRVPSIPTAIVFHDHPHGVDALGADVTILYATHDAARTLRRVHVWRGRRPARGRSVVLVSPTGQIGALWLDRSTEADVRRLAGPPARVSFFADAGGGPLIGKELEYRCGRGCQTSYIINRATGRITDFMSNSPRLGTPHGSRVGMSQGEVERREGVRARSLCLTSVTLHSGPRRLELEIGPERTLVRFILSGSRSHLSC
jgi:hypothetical protein